MIDRQRLLERFLRYVSINTTAREEAGCYPSSPGQMELGAILVSELHAMGISDAHQDENGIVMATVPGESEADTIAFNAHVDTSPETSGKNVNPRVIENFDGQDVELRGDPSRVITTAQCPELALAKGKTIITTDGTTLLGGDDKAGVAIIMEIANSLLEDQSAVHGPVRLLFTCDEEIGKGVDHVDIQKLNATVCYTFDGGGQDIIDNETFSADLAVVKIKGTNIHPAIAKDKMVNAIRAAGRFLTLLPPELSPEHTEGRDGFLHPYVIEGGVAEVVLKVLLRDFDASQFTRYQEILTSAAQDAQGAVPGSTIEIEFVKQYRNMAEGLVKEPRAVTFAVDAHRALGREPQLQIIRGGTDGSRLTELGLPTPNLSSGQHNIHSPLEWACLDEMLAACQVGSEIVNQWHQQTATQA